MILLDASVLVAAVDTPDANHAAARTLLHSGVEVATIDLALYEVANVAVQWNSATAARELRDRIEAIESHGRLVRVDAELAERAFELAAEHGISAYDAAYAAAARSLGATLVSCDVRDLVRPGLAVLPSDVG